ncbi:hypothetical protein [Chryseobacterium kwangjuense]|uniref:Major facilitator superfamily (MFS) profile domain-containing protein n=1 Tax=Chryseobacterium kwangjuense TaxID=267125 RepID=A0A135W9E8_9FLAO|nr:hypothetical protein [Chryseobacterium kwangjuense]KXH81511.1 hypothetical protein AU378_17575 [Chryseobacterium kwangjuense]
MYKYTKILSILTIPLAALVIFFTCGGHGTYLPFLFIFPFSLLGSFFNEKVFFTFFVVGLLQLPLYGFLLDKFAVKKGFPVVIGIHVICMFIVFILKREDFF